jgi:hypothetical protein
MIGSRRGHVGGDDSRYFAGRSDAQKGRKHSARDFHPGSAMRPRFALKAAQTLGGVGSVCGAFTPSRAESFCPFRATRPPGDRHNLSSLLCRLQNH